jgi:hypothetical protein
MGHSGYSNKWKFRSAFVFILCFSNNTNASFNIQDAAAITFSIIIIIYWSYIVGGSETPMLFETIAVAQYRRWCTGPWRWHKKSNTEFWEDKRHLPPLQNLLTSSQEARIFIIPCLTVPARCSHESVLRHLGSCLNESKPFHQIWKLVNVQPSACELNELVQFICIHMWYVWQDMHYILISKLHNFPFYNWSFILILLECIILTFPLLLLDHSKNKNPSLII